MVIQAKRYKSWPTLLSSLKDEVQKVSQARPSRYILTCTVSLTPGNKQTIIDLFEPYILSSQDIFGRDDLNNLLGLYPDIEKKYYKLWLSSTNVLNQVLHSRIYNITKFELEEVNEQIKLYVQNDSFQKALDILKTHQYVIISGIPGIGKTTLARILVFYLLARGHDEFVFLSDSINDGFELFKEETKQVFFFDDFLGRNSLGERNMANEDSKIVKFIKKVKSSPGKILIFTTREYIMNQAIYTYNSFKINNIEVGKCILDLSVYTKFIRAQIIYNHLFFANVPTEYLKSLISSRKYQALVKHPNYNPRILETIVNYKIWEKCDALSFPSIIIEYFDNPESVWLDAFENSLDRFSRYSLLVLLSLGTPVLIEDWEKAVKHFVLENAYIGLVYDSIEFNKILKVLESSFIRSRKDSTGKIAIEYQNPSVQDFLVNYIRGKNEIIRNIIESSVFINQFFFVFTTDSLTKDTIKRKVTIDPSLVAAGFNRVQKLYSGKLQSSKLVRRVYPDKRFYWHVDEDVVYSFFNKMRIEYEIVGKPLVSLIYSFLNNTRTMISGDFSERESYISLLKSSDMKELRHSDSEIIDEFLYNLHWIENIIQLNDLRAIFPITFNDVLRENSFVDIVSEVVSSEIDSLDSSDIASYREQIDKVAELFNISMKEEYERLAELEEETSREIAAEDIPVISSFKSYNGRSYMTEDQLIDEMFNSLLS